MVYINFYYYSVFVWSTNTFIRYVYNVVHSLYMSIITTTITVCNIILKYRVKLIKY